MDPSSKSSLVSVYRRPDAYFIVSSARTTMGVWLHDGEPRRLPAAGVDPTVLGTEVLARVNATPRVVVHPRPEEWPQRRREGLAPILDQAKVRTWRAFTSSSALVEIDKEGDLVTVIPMRPMSTPPGAFDADPDKIRPMVEPSALDLGETVLSAFQDTDSVGAQEPRNTGGRRA